MKTSECIKYDEGVMGISTELVVSAGGFTGADRKSGWGMGSHKRSLGN